MARKTSEEPALTLGNRIYLYGLLTRELGCGKQTFLPRVEEALASDRMTAEDLGFESTRALLEALDDCVNLTIFKGGRIYATVIAQPAWDEALAAPADTKANAAAKGGKPWKRKKADKSLKPARPRRVKRAVVEETAQETVAVEQTVLAKTAGPSIEPAAVETSDVPAGASESNTKAEVPAATEPKADSTSEQTDREADVSAAAEPSAPEVVAKPDQQRETTTVPQPESAPETITDQEPNRSETASSAAEPVSTPASVENTPAVVKPAPQPTISLTVTYDPYNGGEGETTLEATGIAAAEPTPQTKPVADTKPEAPAASASKPQPAQTSQPSPTSAPAKLQIPVEPHETAKAPVEPHEPSPALAPVAPPEQAPAAPVQQPSDTPSAAALASWPRDFAAEVFCSHELIAELVRLLPLGTSAMPLLAQDYRRARDLNLVRGTRARATFPLRIEHETTTGPILITIRHQRGTGLSWTLTKIE